MKYREIACGAVPVLSLAFVSLGNAAITGRTRAGFFLEQRVARIHSGVWSASESFSRTGNFMEAAGIEPACRSRRLAFRGLKTSRR